MGIRKHIQWNAEKCGFDGFCTNSNTNNTRKADNSDNNNSIAKDALVFMAVGSNFKIPVAYFLLNGLDGIEARADFFSSKNKSPHPTDETFRFNHEDFISEGNVSHIRIFFRSRIIRNNIIFFITVWCCFQSTASTYKCVSSHKDSKIYNFQ